MKLSTGHKPSKEEMAQAKQDRAKERAQHLNSICMLEVVGRVVNGDFCFEFRYGERTVNTVWTYTKAKLYAEGVALGRRLSGRWV